MGWGGGEGADGARFDFSPGTLNLAGSRHLCLGLFSKKLVFARLLGFESRLGFMSNGSIQVTKSQGALFSALASGVANWVRRPTSPRT